MPDGVTTSPGVHARGEIADARLVHRVRWQLIGWSAGSTLAVLLVLGLALYAAVAATLTSASESLLHDRANLVLLGTVDVSSTPAGGSSPIVDGGP